MKWEKYVSYLAPSFSMPIIGPDGTLYANNLEWGLTHAFFSNGDVKWVKSSDDVGIAEVGNDGLLYGYHLGMISVFDKDGNVMSLGPAKANGVIRIGANSTLYVAIHNSDELIRLGPAPLLITDTSLSDGLIGTPYSYQMQASGGTPPYTWSLTPGSQPLPSGLSFNTDGLLSGKPTVSGSVTLSVRLTDSGGATVEKDLILRIGNPPAPPLSIDDTSLPDGIIYTAYSHQMQASGGMPPYAWSLAPGSQPLPLGFRLTPTVYSLGHRL
jgi:hypothetical protein